MKFSLIGGLVVMMSVAALAGQQVTAPIFDITGTSIPAELLKVNYGPLPKGISAYDLNICNVSDQRHSLVSSAIYQALSESQSALRPVGRQVMLAAILRNQNHSVQSVIGMALSSTTSGLSVVSHSSATSGWTTGVALGALVAQQVLAAWKPALTADQVEKFESQVLESALVLDGGSCVERTVFTAVAAPPATKPQAFEFHVR